MKNIFPNFDVNVINYDLSDYRIVGQYNSRSDVIVLDKSLNKLSPLYRQIVLLHEMFHSTLSPKRTLRLERLISQFGQFKKGSLSYKVEECIAEICTMVACLKMGTLNPYTRLIIEEGLQDNYTKGMYIPWKEVVSCLTYFSNDDVDFTKELDFVKCYMIAKYDMNIKSSYVKIAG